MIDTIRDGSAPEIIRRKAAEGTLPVPLEEKIEALVLLTRDVHEEIRAKAVQTIQAWNPEELHPLLANPATPAAVLDFAANYLAPGRASLLEALLENPSLPPDLREEIESRLLRDAQKDATTAPPTPPPPPEAAPAEGGPGQDKETLIQKISRMTVVEKIKAALTGNMESRMLLIRDSNKLVSRAVLQSPKLSDSEMESYASAKNVSEEVLRLIAMNRAFMKSYSIIRSLVNNPRAPLDITLGMITRLNDRDLKMLGSNRNVPETIRTTAIKLLKQKEEAKKTKLPSKGH